MADNGKVNIHGKEYETVASRVQRFRAEYGDKYSIITEIISADDDIVVMKATIAHKVPQEGVISEQAIIATGHAEEKRSSSQINRTSALENAETSAIGRALAAFGMGGTEFASADEVANAIQQRAPKPPQKPSVATAAEPELKGATPVQRGKIKALLQRRGIEVGDMPEYLHKNWGIKPGSTLMGNDAVKIIAELKADEDEALAEVRAVGLIGGEQ